MAYCRACGRAIEANARFCRQCGATIANHEPAARDAIAPVPDVQPPMPQAGPLGRIRLVLANPEMLKAVSKAAGKSMALSAAVLGPGLLLLALGQVVLGTIWLFAGSFAMVAWTYRKPWRLGLVSCLIPPVAAGLCYIVQLILFANANLPFLLVLGGILAGCAAGWIRAQTHEVYLENGQYFAQRSIAYLAIWAAAFGITQLLGLLASNVWLIRAGLVTGAFSTAMLALVSIVVWRKRARVGAQTVVLLLAVAAIMAPSPLYAQFASDRASARDLLADAASRVVLHSNPGQVFPLGAPQISGSNDLATATYRTQIGIAYYHFVVILSRHANATAAQPAAGDLRNIPVVARRVFEGASVVLSGHVAGGPGPGRRVAQTAGATARENFKIVTHADASYTNTGSPGGRTALGSSTIDTAAMMDGFVRVGTITMTEQMTARYARQLRLDGSLVSARPTPPPPVAQPAPAPRVTQPSPAATPQPPQWTPPDTSSLVVQRPEPANDPDTDESAPDKGDLAAAAAIIATVLIAAGIAANIAQSIAIAIASAAQSGVELTAEQIQGMVGKGMWDTVTGDKDVTVTKATKPATPPPDIDKPPPPSLIDPLTRRLIPTNDKGQYLIGGRWVDLAEARGLVATGKALKELLAQAGSRIGNVGLGGDTSETADDAGRLWRRVHDIERAARDRGYATPGDIGRIKSLLGSLGTRKSEEGVEDSKQAARDQMKVTAAETIFWSSTGALASAGGTAFVAGSRLGPALSEAAWGTAGGFISGGAMGGISSSTGRGEEAQIGEIKVGDTKIPVKIAVPKVDLTTLRDATLGAVFGGSTSYSGSGGGMAKTMGSGALGGASESITRQAIEGEGIDPSAVAQDAVTGALSQGGQSLIEGRLGISKNEVPVDPSRISRRTSVPRDSGDHYTGPSQRTPASRPAASSHVDPSSGGPRNNAAHRDIDLNPRFGLRPGSTARDVDHGIASGRAVPEYSAARTGGDLPKADAPAENILPAARSGRAVPEYSAARTGGDLPKANAPAENVLPAARSGRAVPEHSAARTGGDLPKADAPAENVLPTARSGRAVPEHSAARTGGDLPKADAPAENVLPAARSGRAVPEHSAARTGGDLPKADAPAENILPAARSGRAVPEYSAARTGGDLPKADASLRSHSQIDPADLRRNSGEAYGHEEIPFDDLFRTDGGGRN